MAFMRPIGRNNQPAHTACDRAPPVSDCCPDTCLLPQAMTCAPRTKTKNAIRIKPTQAETCVLVTEYGCGAEVVPAHLNCIDVLVRRRGFCSTLLKFRPLRAELDGSVCIAWPQEFWQQGDGYYEVDLVFNSKQTLTFLVFSAVPSLSLYSYNVPERAVCLVIPDCAPQVEDIPYTPTEESCDAQC